MTDVDPRFAATLAVAERIDALLRARGIDAIVIGAIALAVHNHPRATEDMDLALAVTPARLRELADDLRAFGWDVVVRLPDADDPLGGVVDIHAPGADLVQLVNFDNAPAGGFPRLVREAVASSIPLTTAGTLRVVDLPALVAFKLYAGGPKSKLDILELLDRNQPVDIDGLRRRCVDLGLGRELDVVLDMLPRP